MKIQKSVTGMCPLTKSQKTIFVQGETLNFCGDASEHFAKTSFKCDSVEQCPHRGACPLFNAVQNY